MNEHYLMQVGVNMEHTPNLNHSHHHIYIYLLRMHSSNTLKPPLSLRSLAVAFNVTAPGLTIHFAHDYDCAW